MVDPCAIELNHGDTVENVSLQANNRMDTIKQGTLQARSISASAMTNSANSPLFEMKRSSIILCAVLVALCLPFTGIAQTVMMSPAGYDAAKLNRSLPEGAQPILAPVPDGTRPSLRGG